MYAIPCMYAMYPMYVYLYFIFQSLNYRQCKFVRVHNFQYQVETESHSIMVPVLQSWGPPGPTTSVLHSTFHHLPEDEHQICDLLHVQPLPQVSIRETSHGMSLVVHTHTTSLTLRVVPLIHVLEIYNHNFSVQQFC